MIIGHLKLLNERGITIFDIIYPAHTNNLVSLFAEAARDGTAHCAMLRITGADDESALVDTAVITRDFSAGDCGGAAVNKLEICEVRVVGREVV